jgi:hypothetical protein
VVYLVGKFFGVMKSRPTESFRIKIRPLKAQENVFKYSRPPAGQSPVRWGRIVMWMFVATLIFYSVDDFLTTFQNDDLSNFALIYKLGLVLLLAIAFLLSAFGKWIDQRCHSPGRNAQRYPAASLRHAQKRSPGCTTGAPPGIEN